MRWQREHDFEARVHLLTPDEGGAKKRLPGVGLRTELSYPDYPEDRSVWLVWPLEFFTDSGDIPEGEPAPHDGYARFWILDPELRESVHRPRLRPGVRFDILMGHVLLGHGVVTKLVALAADPP